MASVRLGDDDDVGSHLHGGESVNDMIDATTLKCGVCAKSRALEPNMVCEPTCAWCMADAESGTREGCAEVVSRFKSEFRGYTTVFGDTNAFEVVTCEKGEVWRCLRCGWAVVFGLPTT